MHGAAIYGVPWIPSRNTPFMLALIYQHHGSVMGMSKSFIEVHLKPDNVASIPIVDGIDSSKPQLLQTNEKHQCSLSDPLVSPKKIVYLKIQWFRHLSIMFPIGIATHSV